MEPSPLPVLNKYRYTLTSTPLQVRPYRYSTWGEDRPVLPLLASLRGLEGTPSPEWKAFALDGCSTLKEPNNYTHQEKSPFAFGSREFFL